MMSDKLPEQHDLIIASDDYIALGNQQSQTSNDRCALADYDRRGGAQASGDYLSARLANALDPKIALVYNCRGLLKNVHIQDISVALALDPQVVN
jgi:hypothetical protein